MLQPQLYSNLVNYLNSTTYLCLVFAVLCSLVVSRVRLASLHTKSMDPLRSLVSCHHHHVVSCAAYQVFPFLLITEKKGGPTHGFKPESLFAQQK